MRSQEMPTISQVQKASELMQEQEWHLNSDGTTLMQQKKAAFLINGIVWEFMTFQMALLKFV